MDASGAAAVIIGNEVLSAKVEDSNGPLLIRRLREQGIRLHSLTVVPDEVDPIVQAMVCARAVARWVFTSGGIGPTHDDVTIRAVALALGRRVVRLPEIEALLALAHPAGSTAEALRLAEAPEGTTLLAPSGTRYPVLTCDGIFLLPGVPSLFRIQLETVLSTLPHNSVHLRSLYVLRGEAEIAATLDRVALGTPQVDIGSYPEFADGADHRVRVTVEGPVAAEVEAVVARLQRELPDGAVLRIE
jgi:molybdenum cofactor synthesis domain-containing protein